ncbi:isoprenyl transferase [Oceanibaculum nanhaiense]|uniref:isoprenyl transferase n=1 Tax=Oceanibaculum nanhaiense TaxID=1909734 RepID=UPI000A362CD0|nr:isoprenyl transferase [Oceanibaculum nanhaiense]
MAVLEHPQDRQPPVHVAIIMDGNGRWAMARGQPRSLGHKQGAEAVRRTVRSAGELGIGYLTLFGFSSENWRRPTGEIDDLMGLLRFYLRREIAELHGNNVRFRMIGDRSRLAPDIVALIENAERLTAGNGGLVLTVALSYGGRQEIAQAARTLAAKAAAGELDPAAIDETMFAGALETQNIPDPDLLIRTSGEKRISNFLLWQTAYSELVFLDVLWPDFGREHLEEAIHEFHRRERRFGTAVG